jgi:hypothetical protein
MRDNHVHDRHREIISSVTTRLSWLSAFTPEQVVLRSAAAQIEDAYKLAESYAQDAERWHDECERSRATVKALEAAIATLDADRASLHAHLRAKTRADATAAATDLAVVSSGPTAGEVRFYKKHYAHRSYDVFIRVADCKCNRWQGGHAGHKAHDGIAKLEGNRTDWKTIHHCASCTGGGMWRVKW